MRFAEALTALTAATREKNIGMRLCWWRPDVVIRIQRPDENSKMTHQYLYVDSRKGTVPWLPTTVEMFSEEWEMVK